MVPIGDFLYHGFQIWTTWSRSQRYKSAPHTYVVLNSVQQNPSSGAQNWNPCYEENQPLQHTRYWTSRWISAINEREERNTIIFQVPFPPVDAIGKRKNASKTRILQHLQQILVSFRWYQLHVDGWRIVSTPLDGEEQEVSCPEWRMTGGWPSSWPLGTPPHVFTASHPQLTFWLEPEF